jgi:hypothetical protein
MKKASAMRKANGWAPVVEYYNGGKIIGQQRFSTMEEAIQESENLIDCMDEHPVAFENNHPQENQLIDLSKKEYDV